MIAFGPQLIGQTEKALGALLDAALTSHDLTGAEWVTLRLTEQFETTATPDTESLAEFIENRAHFADPRALLSGLAERGFVAGDRLTKTGKALLTTIKAQIDELAAPVWTSLDPDDTAAAERVLNIVHRRAQAIVSVPNRSTG